MKVGIILGSKSDIDFAKETIKILKNFNVKYNLIISSAHRSPERTHKWAIDTVSKENIEVIIAIAGAAAHLAGVVASYVSIPVIAVPINSTSLMGLDALLSMVQMPAGVPVATMSIGKQGAKNAAIFAIQILSLKDDSLKEKLKSYKLELAKKVEIDHFDTLKNLDL
ncbi:MAG: 5-(carboxyamino)imidazole ribonucleotide mutase [Deferribacterota bacterium]|nr:5-(carboxyamino)imidazole ribonucleotide mutase [Deferribacterota bacterium]